MPAFAHPAFRTAFLMLVLPLCSATVAAAATAPDLSSRITIDGASRDFTLGEAVFAGDEEGTADSDWGVDNDIKQIYISWDANYLYCAVDAIIWNNNVVLVFDIADGTPNDPQADGLSSMTEINSWRRNFDFGGSPPLTPDCFVATWDGNPTPRLLEVLGPREVREVVVGTYAAVSTFSQGSRGRAMEAAIPWPLLIGADAERVFVPEIGDTLYRIPEDVHELRVAGFITAGADGTGGPDSAPDNLQGHTSDSANRVLIDNYAMIPLDLDAESSPLHGFLDMGIEPRERLSFRVQPPVRGVTFEITAVDLARTIVSPEENRPLEFTISISPDVRPEEDAFRTVTLTAEIYSIDGRRVRTLYVEDQRLAVQPNNAARDVWDGRDESGRMVDGGIYMLQVVSEPGLHRWIRPFSVVR